jgi:hypothetical protein
MCTDVLLIIPMLLFTNIDNSPQTQIINTVIELEGGDKLTYDHGLPTKYGIAQFYNRGIDVKALTKVDAVEFYRAEYEQWGIDDYPESTRLVIFDMFVNHGYYGGIKLLAKCKKPLTADGILYHREQHYRDIAARNSNKAKYLQGWLNRLNLLRKYNIKRENE